MPKKHRKQGPGDATAYAKRIAFLLQNVWGGNQSAMALELGVSQPVISQTSRGVRAPGRSLLAAIASSPKVNPMWLYQGVGEPLMASGSDVAKKEWEIPIAKELLPGLPRDHATLLSGEAFPVAGFGDRQTQYLYRVPLGEPILEVAEEKVAVGDLILFEADPTVWRGNVRVLNNRLCVVRQETDGNAICVIGRAVVAPATDEVEVYVFGRARRGSSLPPEKPGLYIGQRRRRIDVRSSEDEISQGAEKNSPGCGGAIDPKAAIRPVSATLDDIVSFGILLIRL